MTQTAFLGTFANLMGYRVGANFYVDELMSRDTRGAPVWCVVCRRCGHSQPIAHGRLAPLLQGRRTEKSLHCANPGCELSRSQSGAETISEFRQREQKQSEQAAKTAAEAQRTADEQVTKERAKTVRNEEIQRQYMRYIVHQWRAGQDDDRICTRQRWFELTDATRRTVLDLIERESHVRVNGF